MREYQLTQLNDRDIDETLSARIVQERRFDAVTLAYLAEFDQRKLYLPAGYPSMWAYCVTGLRLSKGSASKRIQAARAARAHPVLFEMMADGRLNVSSVVVLAPWLRPENSAELIQAAAGKAREEIELLLARRFPRTESLSIVCPLPPPGTTPQSPGTVIADDTEQFQSAANRLPHEHRPRTIPIADQRFRVEITLAQSEHEDLQMLRNLLSHKVPSGAPS